MVYLSVKKEKSQRDLKHKAKKTESFKYAYTSCSSYELTGSQVQIRFLSP